MISPSLISWQITNTNNNFYSFSFMVKENGSTYYVYYAMLLRAKINLLANWLNVLKWPLFLP